MHDEWRARVEAGEERLPKPRPTIASVSLKVDAAAFAAVMRRAGDASRALGYLLAAKRAASRWWCVNDPETSAKIVEARCHMRLSR